MTDRKKQPRKEIVVENIIPKVFAQKCPVCNGFGTVSSKSVTCHGCGGRGWIVLVNTAD